MLTIGEVLAAPVHDTASSAAGWRTRKSGIGPGSLAWHQVSLPYVRERKTLLSAIRLDAVSSTAFGCVTSTTGQPASSHSRTLRTCGGIVRGPMMGRARAVASRPLGRQDVGNGSSVASRNAVGLSSG